MTKVMTLIVAVEQLQDLNQTYAQLNCSLPAAEKAEVSDTHGGFHGEGEYAAAIRFDTVHGAQLTEQLQNTDGWKALPLEEELELLMYGGSRHYRTLNVMFCSAFFTICGILF